MIGTSVMKKFYRLPTRTSHLDVLQKITARKTLRKFSEFYNSAYKHSLYKTDCVEIKRIYYDDAFNLRYVTKIAPQFHEKKMLICSLKPWPCLNKQSEKEEKAKKAGCTRFYN